MFLLIYWCLYFWSWMALCSIYLDYIVRMMCDVHFMYLSQHVRMCCVCIDRWVQVETCLNPPLLSGYTTQTLFNPNKTVVKMFVVMYDLRAMPAGHQTFLRQRTFSVPVRRDTNNQTSRKPLGHGRTLRYLVHLRWVGCHFGSNAD